MHNHPIRTNKRSHSEFNTKQKEEKKKRSQTAEERLFKFYQNNPYISVRNISIKVTFWTSLTSQRENNVKTFLENNLSKIRELNLNEPTRTVSSKTTENDPLLDENHLSTKSESILNLEDTLESVLSLLTSENEKKVSTKSWSSCWHVSLSEFFRLIPKKSYLMEMFLLHSRKYDNLSEILDKLSNHNKEKNYMKGGRYDFLSWDRNYHASRLNPNDKRHYKPIIGFGLNVNEFIQEKFYNSWDREQKNKHEQYYNIQETDVLPSFGLCGSSNNNRVLCNNSRKSNLQGERAITYSILTEDKMSILAECQIKSITNSLREVAFISDNITTTTNSTAIKINDNANQTRIIFLETRHIKVNLSEFCHSESQNVIVNEDVIQCLVEKFNSECYNNANTSNKNYSSECLTSCALLLSFLGVFPRNQ